ncbi:MAG: lipopolysaccharide biosynthesis protein [Treponema sp.]|jgi:uncharacterized protein involved in exopolysaccharide biosynthesis|nr:lipopolysaccharide biosynthesis protein [Treponema sp.]
MKDDADGEEISLIDLFSVIWRRKWFIIIVCLTAAIGAAGFSIISLVLPPEKSPLPNVYTPKALMLINNAGSSGGGLASMLSSSGLGGLASLAGVSVPAGSTFSQLAVYLTGTNTLLDAVADEFGFIERYKIQKFVRAESRKALQKNLTAEFDDKSGVFSISFEDTDPLLAQRVVNYCVAFLERRFDELGVDKNKLEKENLEKNIENTLKEIKNLENQSRQLERSVSAPRASLALPAITTDLTRITMELEAQRQVYTQLKVQYEILKVTMSSEKPVFQTLELAEIPDQKSGPSRGLLCVIVVFGAFFLAVFTVFVINAVENIRKDPEAMAKIRGLPA